MQFEALDIPGCYWIDPFFYEDERGSFLKTFHEKDFKTIGLSTDFKEEYVSISKKNVLRGMHFQLPPYDHDKLVYCIKGRVLDAFIDLRKGSPRFRQHRTIELSDQNRRILYLPKGIAHGFYTLSDEAIMVYKTSTVHNPEFDTGVLWDECGIGWPTKTPVLSDRDKGFLTLKDFNSPFEYR